MTQAKRLEENKGKAFQGTIKMGNFNLPYSDVEAWLDSPNPSGKSNREVIRPWVNGMDITRRPSNTWIIDFNRLCTKSPQKVALAQKVEELHKKWSPIGGSAFSTPPERKVETATDHPNHLNKT